MKLSLAIIRWGGDRRDEGRCGDALEWRIREGKTLDRGACWGREIEKKRASGILHGRKGRKKHS